MDLSKPGKLAQADFMKKFNRLITKGRKHERELKFDMKGIIALVDENPHSAMTLMKVLAVRVMFHNKAPGEISNPMISYDMHCLGALIHAYINARGKDDAPELVELYRDYPAVLNAADYAVEHARITR